MGNDYDGGVFTIAYAIGNLMMTIGKYGMRNFQATDVNEKYSYKEYETYKLWIFIKSSIEDLVKHHQEHEKK